jgi:TatD DNase family protein
MIIDTHAHIYDQKFDNDRVASIESAKAQGISKILMPNCAAETIDAMLACETQFPNYCIPMMGLHPCYVSENFEQELSIAKAWLDKRKFCAIGEIGLDYYWDKTFVAEQKQAFLTQIEWALHYKLPIVIHSRESTADCIEIIKPFIADGLRGVFHCYSGTLQEAQIITDMGFYLGIGGVVTYKKSGLDEIVKQIDTKYLVLETDAPYLAPVPHRGKRNECSYTRIIAQCVADIKEMPLQELAAITTTNASNLFSLQ